MQDWTLGGQYCTYSSLLLHFGFALAEGGLLRRQPYRCDAGQALQDVGLQRRGGITHDPKTRHCHPSACFPIAMGRTATAAQPHNLQWGSLYCRAALSKLHSSRWWVAGQRCCWRRLCPCRTVCMVGWCSEESAVKPCGKWKVRSVRTGREVFSDRTVKKGAKEMSRGKRPVFSCGLSQPVCWNDAFPEPLKYRIRLSGLNTVLFTFSTNALTVVAWHKKACSLTRHDAVKAAASSMALGA